MSGRELLLKPISGPASSKFSVLMNTIFLQDLVRGKSVLDVGANAGLYTFGSWLHGGASRITLYEPDIRFHKVYREVESFIRQTASCQSSSSSRSSSKKTDTEKSETTNNKLITALSTRNRLDLSVSIFQEGNKNYPWDLWLAAADPENPLKAHDFVFFFASIHWLFACTDYHKNFNILIELMSSFANEGMLVEWIDEFEENRIYQAHLDEGAVFTVPLDLESRFTEEIFVRELYRNWENVEQLPNYNFNNFTPTRKLYLATGKRAEKLVE